jgi:peptide/nickel transport system substrate-binding protein
VRRLALALAAALAAAACGGRAETTPPDVVVVALANSPTNLDPGISLDEASQKIEQVLYSSLLKIDTALQVVPDLATHFETEDHLNYLVRIPAGVKFHDGREMTSQDVAYTFRRFLDPRFTSGRKGAYRDLKAVDVVDRYAVMFRLKQPSAAFPITLVMGIVPAGIGAEAGRRPIGSGPYQLVQFLPDDRVVVEAFDAYYGGPPQNRGLIFRVVPDETMRGLELRKGSVDLVVNDLSPDLVHGLRRDGRLSIVTSEGTDYAYMGFNLRDPLLKDRRVRQAISYAIDTRAIIEHLRRGLARSATGVVPSMSWAYEPNVQQYPRDLARAAALLDEAGFRDPDGPGPAPRLRLTLKTSTAEPYRVQAAVIQQNLAEAGIAIEIRSFEFATLMADVVRGNVQLYTLQYVGVTDPDMLRRAFHSLQVPPDGFNRGHYVNPELDRVIAEATASLDETERGRLYRLAQQIVAADAPYVNLWSRINVAVAQPSLRGVTLSPIAEFTFLKDVKKLE